MTGGKPSSSSDGDGEHRVISFRRGRPATHLPAAGPAPVEDLGKYQRGREPPDDYRHRMIVNAVAFAFVVLLIGAALWLADTLADMHRNQDCVLSGRRGCTPVEVTTDRW